MSLGRHKFRKAFDNFSEQKRDEENLLSGILGLPTGAGQDTVEVDGRDGFVYVRLRDNLNEVIQAYNDKVSPVYGLPVLITRDKINSSYYRIVTRDVGRYQRWETTSSYLPKHGNQHRFEHFNSGGGGDVVFVEGRQFVPLALTPSGSVGSGNVVVQGSHFYTGGEWHWAGDTGTPDILAFKPLSGTSNVVLVYIDGADNNPKLLEGQGFDPSISGTANIIPFLPQVLDSEDVPLGAVQLHSGTERIAWEQIYDLRPYIVGSAFIPTGTYGHIIRDDGIDMSKRSHLNFIGQNVWVRDDPANYETEIIISGSAGGGDTRRTIKDEGVAETDRNNLNFIGNGVFITDDVGNDELEIIISGSSNRYGIRDEGAPQTQRDWLNFVGAGVFVNDDPANDELEIIITGSTATTPGGNNAYVQFNDNGAFGGVDELQFNKVLQRLSLQGVMRVNDGSAGDPTYRFISDYNTGFYLDGPDIIGVTAGGAVRAKIHVDKVEILTALNVSGTSNLNGAGGVFVRGGALVVETLLNMDNHNILNVGYLDVDGQVVIDETNTEAFLVRKDGDGGDVFVVDTVNSTITLPNVGLHILDTNASHDLIIAPGSDLTADRTLTLTTGDAARIITLNGNPTLNDWFSQSVKQAATPIFAGLTLEGNQIIDNTATEALLVRKNADGGDVFRVDTTNGRVLVGPATPIAGFQIASTGGGLFYFEDTGGGANQKIFRLTVDNSIFSIQSRLDNGGNPGGSGIAYQIVKDANGDVDYQSWHTANNAIERMRIDSGGGLKLKELATAGADTAAFGQIWVKTATPNELWFTDDAGTDHQIAFV